MTGLNHLNLAVPRPRDLEALFITAFGFHKVAERGEGNFIVLRNDEGFTLTLMTDKNASQSSYPQNFHLGFLQTTDAAVHAVHERIAACGYDLPPVGQVRHGEATATGFYFRTSAGILIEVSNPQD